MGLRHWHGGSWLPGDPSGGHARVTGQEPVCERGLAVAAATQGTWLREASRTGWEDSVGLSRGGRQGHTLLGEAPSPGHRGAHKRHAEQVAEVGRQVPRDRVRSHWGTQWETAVSAVHWPPLHPVRVSPVRLLRSVPPVHTQREAMEGPSPDYSAAAGWGAWPAPHWPVPAWTGPP